MELLVGPDDRLACLLEVRDVVEWVVQAKDVDAVLRRAGDEAPDDVLRDGLRADEEATTEREAERRRGARVDRTDPLPGALDGAAHGRVEDAAARDLEVGEAGLVEDLGDPEDVTRGYLARQGLLRQQSDRRVDEFRHLGIRPYRAAGARRETRAARPRSGSRRVRAASPPMR